MLDIARMLLGAPGLTTRNKKLLGAPGMATRSKDATGGGTCAEGLLETRCTRPKRMHVARSVLSQKVYSLPAYLLWP